MKKYILLLSSCIVFSVSAQVDTLKVMSYNVLNYGNYASSCQTNTASHAYLKTIISFTKPDILGLVKMSAIYPGTGFGDSIVNQALNPAVPINSYGYCTITNQSGDSKTSVLFYNKNKLGFLSTNTLVANISDFNLHKFYYKDPHLSTTKDTTFLYVVLNHTKSGTGSDSLTRSQQEASVLQELHKRFSSLPNLIMMGDFNLHSSLESFYQNYVAGSDTNFRFYDPPFSIDNKLTYPADWDLNPAPYAPYLTTSTRQSAAIPNACGTDGGGKSWYDHMLLSTRIVKNTNYVSYVKNSYHTIGNDGFRTGISINDSSSVKNTSAPPAVINALFQLSNKFPISANLVITQNTIVGHSFNTEIPQTLTGIAQSKKEPSQIVLYPNPAFSGTFTINSESEEIISIKLRDIMGREVNNSVTFNSPYNYFIQVPDYLGSLIVTLTLKSGTPIHKIMILNP